MFKSLKHRFPFKHQIPERVRQGSAGIGAPVFRGAAIAAPLNDTVGRLDADTVECKKRRLNGVPGGREIADLGQDRRIGGPFLGQ